MLLLIISSITLVLAVETQECQISGNRQSQHERFYKKWIEYKLSINATYRTGKYFHHINVKGNKRKSKENKLLSKNNIQVIREEKECLYGHNLVRSLHDESQLQWDKDLAFEAEQWALHMAILDKGPIHSSFTDSKGNKYGENIYWWGGSDIKHCHNAIYLWYKEIEEYDFQNPVNSGSTGHFIQLVWDNTVKIGVGVVYSNEQTWIVARYSPAESGPVGSHVHKPGEGFHIPTESQLIPSNNPDPYVFTVKIKKTGGPGATKPCTDQNSNCNYWLKQGYCSDEDFDVRDTCPVTCGVCKEAPPINGGYTMWFKSSKCSVNCGGGQHTMVRYCEQPYPSNGGKECTGPSTKLVSCNTDPCESRSDEKENDCKSYKEFCYCPKHGIWKKANCKANCNVC